MSSTLLDFQVEIVFLPLKLKLNFGFCYGFAFSLIGFFRIFDFFSLTFSRIPFISKPLSLAYELIELRDFLDTLESLFFLLSILNLAF